MSALLAEPSDELASLVGLLRTRATDGALRPAYTFLLDGETREATLTYGELDRRARAIGALLQQHRARGKRALLLYPPGLDYIAGFFGCLCAGVIAVPAYPPRRNQRINRLIGILADSQASIALTTGEIHTIAQRRFAECPALEALQWIETDGLEEGLEDAWQEADVASDSPAFIQYTSGSTAAPRGVVVSHGNLLSNERMIQRAFGQRAGGVGVGWLPLYHDMGLIGNMLQPLYAGYPCVLMSPTAFLEQPVRWLRAVTRYRGTISGGPDSAYKLCADKVTPEEKAGLDLSSWQVAFNGSEPVRAETMDRFANAFASCGFRREAFYPCYGLAEATLLVTGKNAAAAPVVLRVDAAALDRNEVVSPTDAAATRALVGCGPVAPGQDVVIVHPESWVACPPNRIGEIWVRGPSVTQGYWNQPQETARHFHARLAHSDDATYLRTGDLGCVKDGELFVTGRLKDLIIVRGRNHYPQDIEITAEESHPALRPGCGAAFAVEVDGEERLIIVSELKRDNRGLDIQEVGAAVRTCVAAEHDVPVSVLVLISPATIPKTSSGKIQRRACRKLFLENRLDVVAEWRADRAAQTVGPAGLPGLTREALLAVDPERRLGVLESSLAAHIARLTGAADAARIAPTLPMKALGLDSLMAAELQTAIATQLGVLVPLARILEARNVSEVAADVLTQLPEVADRLGIDSALGVSSPAERLQPFPLNELQQAYWAGRTGAFELGNVAAWIYLECEGVGLDVARLGRAWQRLIDRHDMLRAVVQSDGQQRILAGPLPYAIEEHDLRGHPRSQVEGELLAFREQMSHRILPVDRWPLFEIHAHQLDGDRVRLHIGVDLLIADGRSLLQLLREWSVLYRSPDQELPPLEYSFRDYVLAELQVRDSELYRRSEVFWKERLPALPPPPELPMAKSAAAVTHPRFLRRSFELSADSWGELKRRAAQAGLTPSGVLLAAYAEVLVHWSSSPHLTVSVTRFHRLPFHPQVNEVVGQFASFTPLAVEGSRRDSFQTRARRLQRELWEALDHRHVGGVQLLREMSRARGRRFGAGLPVVFTSVLGDLAALDSLGEPVYAVSQTPQVLLDNQAFERHGALVINWDAVEEMFPTGLLDDMFGAYRTLVSRLADDADAWAAQSPVRTSNAQLAERARINTTEAPISDALLHDLFALQVRQRPEQLAVGASDRVLTYEQLYQRSCRLGRHLRNAGARPNTLVAVVMEKSWEQVVAVLGVMQSGAAYLPIDPDVPAERLRQLLQDGEVALAVTQPHLRERAAWPDTVRRICVDDDGVLKTSADPLPASQGPDDLAYVIYTSGSTGEPKGAMITHRGVVNAVLATNRCFDVGSADRVLAVTALAHDMSVYDIFGMLAAGGSIVIPEPDGRRDPAHWAELLRRTSVTIWNSVPAMLEMLIEHAERRGEALAPSLRLGFAGGDWIPVSLPSRFRAVAPGAEMVSVGGPTETTLWNIWYRIRDVDPAWRSIPYGRPIPNARYYVLNEFLEACPVWVPGQLYCAGVGLAKGYWRDEERSRASFVRHPVTGERLYRTGDLGRFLPDGNIEFVGRADFQVKIQGYRIEPGEIEHALQQHPAVRAAAVAAFGDPRGQKALAAYTVLHPGYEVTPSDMRRFLGAKLPEYMVPAFVVFLDELPLNANGKVDRTALPDPRALSAKREEAASMEQHGSVGARIERLVSQVLKLDRIAPEDDLASLGATSIDLIRLASLLETEFGFRPRMEDFFRLPRMADVVEYYRRRLGGPVAQEPARARRDMESLTASFTGLADPQEREDFKKRMPGIRRIEESPAQLDLGTGELTDVADGPIPRRSCRRFSPAAVPFDRFCRLLSCLRQRSQGSQPKYWYPSAGGLYPVQAYLHVKPARVAGVPAGTYYYHPREHRLYVLRADAPVDRTIHWPANRPIYDAAAFSLFLVGELKAIAPMYGEPSRDFCLFEAGAMTQLLMMSAQQAQLGLCPIGHVDFEQIRELFQLEDSQTLLHVIVGGVPVEAAEAVAAVSGDPTVAARLEESGASDIACEREHVEATASDHAETCRRIGVSAIPVRELCGEAVLPAELRFDGGVLGTDAEPANVLLSGATGFLGAFLLDALLRHTRAHIHCLVRARTLRDAESRLERVLESYNLWSEAVRSRVTPVPGDLAAPDLGLPVARFRELAARVDAIFHVGALVNWVQPYEALRAANVGGTLQMLRLAGTGKPKPLHFISTVAVFPFDGKAYREDDPLDHEGSLFGGYPQSKWVAEKLVADAKARGLLAAIYRPTIVTGHSTTGVFNPRSYLENLVKGCIQRGSAPLIDTTVDIVPVDYVARAVVLIATQRESLGKVFHLTNPHRLAMSAFLDGIEELGYPLRRLPYERWKRELLESAELETNALYPFAPFIADLGEDRSRIGLYDCRNTLQALGPSVACPPLGHPLLGTYFAYYVESGFLDPPIERRRATA